MCDFPEIKHCSKFHSIHISAEKKITQQSQYARASHITDEQGIREEVVLKILGDGGTKWCPQTSPDGNRVRQILKERKQSP